MSYQGWTNHATWAMKLWIDNSEGDYRYWRDATEEAVEASNGDKTDATINLEDRLEGEYEASMPELEGVWADLLQGAFDEVNWREIAESFVGDVEVEE